MYLYIFKRIKQFKTPNRPAAEWFNRFVHESIRVQDAYKLDESQLIVVYKRNVDTNQVIRRIVKGPCVYMLEANEWLHLFNWHTQDSENVGHMVHKREVVCENAQDASKLVPLTLKPDFFHYYVLKF
jgi:hypothetical protein